MPKPLLLEQIKNTTDTQGRAGIDDDHVADLRAAWEAKADIPSLLVFFDGTDYWLADGFHRLAAARLAKRTSVPCDIQKGTKRDAWLAALAANKSHGLRRTNADKRRCVTLALNDDDLVKWSDGKVADHIGVSQAFVGIVRNELKTVLSSPAAKAANEPKVGKDGKKRNPKPEKKKEPKAAIVTPAECKPGDHIWSSDDDGDFCVNCKVSRVDVEGIPEVVPVKGGDSFDPANIEAHSKSFAAAFAAKVKQHNLEIERYARRVTEVFEAQVPLGAWLDDSRVGMARDSINAAVATLRQAKAHDKPCPRCDGKGENSGKACKSCRGVGFMPKVQYEMAGGQ